MITPVLSRPMKNQYYVFRAVFTNEVLVFDKNVDGLVHYLEILSDDISITVDKSWLWLQGRFY